MSKDIFYPLYENLEFTKSNFGNEFFKDSLKDNLDVSSCVDANEKLSQICYGKEISDALNNNDIDKIKKIKDNFEKNFITKFDDINDYNFKNIGMLLVRPENVLLAKEYINYLSKYDIDLLFSKKVNLSFEQYLVMYYHGLIPMESRCDFPTRTLNYVNKDCILLIFYTNNKELFPLSDFLFSIKGKQGKYRKNTLRGDIAFTALSNITYGNGLYFLSNDYNVLFDPIGMCRLLVRNLIENDRSHDIADLKLLYYVAQSVHVPNYDEIKRDFSVLCDDNDYDKVIQKVKK